MIERPGGTGLYSRAVAQVFRLLEDVTIRVRRGTRPARAGGATVRLALLCIWVAGVPASGVVKNEASVQLEFGVKMALKGSWHEAAFRFDKAIRAGGDTAWAWNNLAVAREHLGRFDAAREAYEKAVALDPGEKRIRENYERFMGYMKEQRGAGGR